MKWLAICLVEFMIHFLKLFYYGFIAIQLDFYGQGYLDSYNFEVLDKYTLR